ncbi:MAG: hypothetical protein ACXU81_16305, partial [Myxococcaceae bacterium]
MQHPESRASLVLAVVIAALGLSPSAARAGDRNDFPPELGRPVSGVHDPGPRGGSPGAGGPLQGLTGSELKLFNEGLFRATELEA